MIRLALAFTAALLAGLALAEELPVTEFPGDVAADDREQVVLLHGFGRNSMSMWLLGNRLQSAGYAIHNIGYRSLRTTTEKMLNTVSGKIQLCCGNSERTTHFVGHSLGGLLIRAYLDKYRNHNIGRVVLIGSPNEGTPFVDKFQEAWWMQLAGSAAMDLGTNEEGFPKSVNTLPYYPLGVIAGDTDSEDLKNRLMFADDGLVPVASTVVAGMKDFIVLRSNHSLMRYNREVADQTIAFLRNGKFDHDSDAIAEAD